MNVKVNDAKKLLETQYPIDSKKKLIVIAMSRWHKNDELWMSDLIKFCNEKKIEIIIKIHQRFQGTSNQTGRSKIMKIEKECNGLKYLISYDMELSTLLPATDLVITESSNVGIDAVLFGKELITIDFSNETYNENFLRQALPKDTSIIKNFNELVRTISDLFLEHKTHEKFVELKKIIIQNHNYYNDYKSSNRIFDILVKK